MRKKISIIGAGNVGATVAQCCLAKALGDIVLLDVAEGVAKGKALDLSHAASLLGSEGVISGTSDYSETADSNLVIVTAGIARKPGMSRDDLLKTNVGIVTQVVRAAIEKSPNAMFVIVSNPLDVMCMAALKASGLPPHRVIGLSGILDSARLRANIAAITGVAAGTVQAMVIGEHGDSMVPLVRFATVGAVPVADLLSPAQLADVAQKTSTGGAAVVAALGYSAYYAPGLATATLAEAIIRDAKAILPCSAYLTGQYQAENMYMCVPVVLGAQGIEKILELKLNKEETQKIEQSITNIKSNISLAPDLAGWSYTGK